MIERVLIAASIFSLVSLLVTTSGFLQRRKAQKEAQAFTADGPRPTPTVLYFWSEACGPCEFVQSPALDALANETTDVDIVRINAVEEPTRASQWGVMTVPTTILIDREGQPKHINNRAIKLPELKQQLAELGVTVS